MPFQLSPGVNVTEIDLTTVVPAVATSDGAIAGIFNWGPVAERILIDSETKLVNTFGKPNSNTAETFFTAANFLGYSNRLYVVRSADTTNSNSSYGAYNAIGNSAPVANIIAEVVKNSNDYNSHAAFDANTRFIAKYPGAIGNSLKVSVCDTTNQFSGSIYADGSLVSNTLYDHTVLQINATIGSNAVAFTSFNSDANVAKSSAYLTSVVQSITTGDLVKLGNSSIGYQYTSLASNSVLSTNATHSLMTVYFNDKYQLSTDFVSNTTVNPSVNRFWEYSNVVDGAPSQTDYVANFGNTAAVDGMHVVVVDSLGKFTGIPGQVLETYQNVSRATDSKTTGGATNYYKNIINQNSKFIWVGNDRGGASSNTAASVATATDVSTARYFFNGGSDGYTESTASLAVLANGYDMFASAEDVDVSIVLQGKPIGGSSNTQLANYLIDNIAEVRKDCVVVITPDDAVVVANPGNEATAIVGWRNQIHDSSYAILDSGYKYQYDRYNDVYRYIPSNGDVAGLCARTDSTRDPWWSPAGFNRGQIKNVLRLRYNPTKADRDILYKNSVNPLVTFPGQGTVLFGDKTLQSKPSAFDHINVRRLFIVLEKAIATASKFTLFEFNDEFTRSQFKNLVTPYLRDVQGRRGITDFLVVCDATNNTPERIDRNEFWGDIYIKPARSINYIQLNFVAVSTGVQFSEVVGQF